VNLIQGVKGIKGIMVYVEGVVGEHLIQIKNIALIVVLEKHQSLGIIHGLIN